MHNLKFCTKEFESNQYLAFKMFASNAKNTDGIYRTITHYDVQHIESPKVLNNLS